MPVENTLLARLLLILLVGISLPALAQNPDPKSFQEVYATPELLQELRRGGFAIYMRHGATDSSQPDQVPIVLNDCRTQRLLSEAGRAEIVEVGKAIRRAGIPIGEIYVSPMCRAQDTAKLAFERAFITENNLMYTAHLTTEEKIPVVAKTRELLSRPVAPGTNRIVLAHAPNLADMMAYFPKVEGSLIIFRHGDNGELQYLATIHPKHWEKLLAEAGLNE